MEREEIMRKSVKIAAVAGAAVVAGVIIAGVASPQEQPAGPAPGITQGATPQAASSPPATPQATGPAYVKGQGSCDYILGDSPATGTARGTGEMDLTNTGGPGKVRLSIRWPSEGMSPSFWPAKVKVAYFPAGAHKVIGFRKALNGDQVDALQSWQERHGFKDGCRYSITPAG